MTMDTNHQDSAIFGGTAYVHGRASGTLMASSVEISLWGGVNPQTSQVIDRHHPLCGRYLKNSVLAIPGGRGSSSGSGVILEMLLNGNGPRALIFERSEDILTLGVIVAEEIFGKSVPVLILSPSDFRLLLQHDGEDVYIDNSSILVGNGLANGIVTGETDVSKSEHDANFYGTELTEVDRTFLDGCHGEASRVAMRLIARMAALLGADELMDVSQVHVDGCHYTGPGSLAFAEKLRDWGGKVKVPTTLNAISIDQRQWRVLGVDNTFGEASDKLAKAYTDMGARSTFTCAPYQLDSAPTKGQQVAWGESNAVVYANSVLGAKTMKYPDFLDIAIALTGRAPKGGVHLASNRLASLCIRITNIDNEVDDSLYPLLGYCIGSMAVTRIPAITGLEGVHASKDNLRAFAAAFATVSSTPMFHIVGVTPEANTLAAVSSGVDTLHTVDFDLQDLNICWENFNRIDSNERVDLISLGNPHASFSEIKKLTQLCQGKEKCKDIAVIVTCSRSVHGLATQAGLIEQLEAFGVQFLTDTCWCFIAEPIIPRHARVIMTNSGKYSHYGPGLTGRQYCFGGLAACVKTACEGVYSGEKPQWLRNAVATRCQPGVSAA